tara:strand:- start:297 stop:704 length:408 start_codon:yes stop_codon:yes gene_type:complete
MEENNWNKEIKANNNNLKLWSVLWVVSMAITTFGRIFIWEENTALNILTILINLGFGVGMILANRKYINALDDLQKKIQTDAMGIALGVGVVGGLSYSLLDQSNVITQDAEIGFLVMLISLTYMIGTLIGQKRYK